MRLTRKVFLDLAIWMAGFGILIGVFFPFFVQLLGVPKNTAMKGPFITACLLSGILVGIINYIMARWVVGGRLHLLAAGMNRVEKDLMGMEFSNDFSRCTHENCSLVVDSADEIGETAQAFNRLVEALAVSLQTQTAVRSFSEMLSSQLEIESLAGNALNLFFEYSGAAGGLVLYESAGELKVAASRGLRDSKLVAASDHVMEVVRSGKMKLIAIPDDVLVEGVVTDFRPREILVCPISYKKISLGIVVLANGSAFNDAQRSRIDLFLPGLGLALNNALIHDRLQRLAALDPLTGTYNRRFGLGRLHEEFGRAVRLNTPLGLLMMDIDHFKTVNDTYGHLVGDRLLKLVCSIARSSLREGDILMRYGGEEFLAVLPAAATEDLRQLGERLRKSVEDGVLKDGDRTVRVTLSVGGAAYPNQNVENEEALTQLADEALYRAKESGRNRVEIAR